MRKLKCLIAGVAASLGLGLFAPALANDYPSRSINIIVPYPPGGVTDGLSRLLGQFLTERLKQPVTVENRPGAGATVGGRLLAAAKADGYTIGVFDPTAITVTPQLYKNPPYDALQAFQPLTRLGNNYQIILANPAAPADTLEELLTLVRADPGMPFATPATVGINSIELERFAEIADFRITNVGYSGAQPLLQDLMAGHILFGFSDVATAVSYIASGKIKPIAVTSSHRLDLLPSVPTIAESGYPGFETAAWFAVFAPAGLPENVLEALDQNLQAFGHSPAYREWARQSSFIPDVSTDPHAFAQSLQGEIAQYTSTARRLNIFID